MTIKTWRHLAVWYQCPQCKRSCGSLAMTPTKKHRDYVGTCFYCNVPEVITRRRYYTTWASDFYGVAGTCEEACRYFFPNIRAFKRTIAERTAQREKEAREYFERERQIQAECEARLRRQREGAAFLREVERVAYRRAHAVELEAEKVARAAWSEEQPDGTDEDVNEFDDHLF